MFMPVDHRVLVKEHLEPLLRASPFNKTKIFTFEDSRKFLKYWIDRVMADPDMAEYIDGVSVHWYEDSETSPEILDEIVMADPDVAEYIDGVSVHWYEDSETSPEILDEIVFNHMSIGFIDWNMALNTEGGPVFPATGPEDAPVIMNASADEFYKNPMFYVLGHFSKFIDEGLYRVDSTSEPLSSITRFGDSGFVCVCNATYCDTFTYPSRSTENFTHIFTSNHTPGYNFRWGTVQNASTLPISLSVSPIAASDFCTRTYTYDDTPGDVTLEHFQLAKEDYEYKIPIINAAKGISRHSLYLVSTPWTSPNWTKTNNNYPPGYLKKEYWPYWANYLLRFLEEYKKEGIDFWGFSISNEPSNSIYMGLTYLINNVMFMPMDHRVFVKQHLGPLLRASPFNKTKIFTFEDSRKFLKYWIDRVMADPYVAEYIDGVSVHWYEDSETSPEILDEIVKKYNKFIIYTEACIPLSMDPTKVVDLGSWKRGGLYAEDIIDVFNHMSIGFIDWNMALNTEGDPVFPASGPMDAPVIVNASADEFYKNPMFYVLGQFSKFIDEGSYRVDSTSEPLSSISHLATTNPDGSTSLFLYNPTMSDLSFWVYDIVKDKAMNITVLAGSLNTIVWW
ncbi:lysosomal acid glucosylceramidase-like [Homalodisca vitripennis]|uniref:lysosomal acid glucosylceramidase-like n=1 Tax=Homalodisca vitripennis TaxID=197043 RepID=UPI001EEAD207|nr:lysosomal acid glucosylceramidase-like [Homalodisca vitripennis]